ncbi:hypothetical protein ACP4OV_011852 [Aristida adscensionis]
MAIVHGAMTRRLEEEGDRTERISDLPNDILSDIVSLLPTKKDGARLHAVTRPLGGVPCGAPSPSQP